MRRVGAFQGGVLSGTLADITWIGGSTTRPTDGSLAVALCTPSDIVPSVGGCSGGSRPLTIAPNASCELPPSMILPTDATLRCGYAALTDAEGLIPTIIAIVLLVLVAVAFLRDWALDRQPKYANGNRGPPQLRSLLHAPCSMLLARQPPCCDESDV